MKNYKIILIGVFVLLSCTAKIKNGNSTVDSLNSNKTDKRSSSEILYSNSSCLDWSIETYPIIELKSDTIVSSDSIRGKLFFSTNYLKQLAKCNQLDYKIAFDVYSTDGGYGESVKIINNDTLLFVMPYDSLKLINSTKKFNEYLLKGNLRATYFKLNEAFWYDTSMTIRKSIFVSKKRSVKKIQ
jgi:hypothetical protein